MSHEVTHYCALMQEVTGSMMMLGRYHHTSSLSKYTVIIYPIDSTNTHSFDNALITHPIMYYIIPSSYFVVISKCIIFHFALTLFPSLSPPSPRPSLSPFHQQRTRWSASLILPASLPPLPLLSILLSPNETVNLAKQMGVLPTVVTGENTPTPPPIPLLHSHYTIL